MNRIKELRQSFGYTQDSLAAMLNCTAASISRYENGKSELDPALIIQFCNIFNCTSDYFLGLTDEPSAQLPRGDELKSELQHMIDGLDPEEEALVKAFIAGMKASRK